MTTQGEWLLLLFDAPETNHQSKESAKAAAPESIVRWTIWGVNSNTGAWDGSEFGLDAEGRHYASVIPVRR